MNSTEKSNTTVSSDATGAVIIKSVNNPEFAYIRIVQEKTIFTDDGFMKRKPVSALIHGTIEDLQSLNWKANQELKGNVIIKESLTPFSKKQPERDYKIAGETGIVCSIDGAPIYRKTTYTTNVALEDTTLQHDNKDAIVAKNAELKAAGLLTPSTDFSL